MPRICYSTGIRARLEKNPGTLSIVAQANQIIQAYQAQGFDLTLRQLYYQFVSKALIPNSDKEYKKLGAIISDARMAGMVDWLAIVDRTRNLRSLAHWAGPAAIVADCVGQFRLDRWATQPRRVEVWIEKDALLGVIAGVCQKRDVPYFSCRGYTSMSEVWGAAQRLLQYQEAGQIPTIFHLGDHDPSGIDMTRDIKARLLGFGVSTLRLKRLALNMDQIDLYNPPPNPAKLTDARAKRYVEKYGHQSWELDALEPTILAGLIDTAVRGVRDPDKWKTVTAIQKQGRQALQAVADALGKG